MLVRIRLVVLFAALTACTPGALGGSLGPTVGIALAVGLLALLVPSRRSATAGAPMPCDGYETRYCADGRMAEHCCPKGAKCNYRDAPYLECGHGLCTTSGDLGRCPAPAPHTMPAADEAACKAQHGDWELVCAKRVVVAACLPPMPTNYMGPGMNPRFELCGKGAALFSGEPTPGERCTTHRLVEDCYPTRAELGEAACAGEWKKMCLGGEVVDKCVPSIPFKPRTWEAATFVSCPDGTCAVGADKRACGGAAK